MKILLPGLILAVMAVSCRKEKAAATINISFTDKPLSVIRSAMVGGWRLHHACGGITGGCSYDPADLLVAFGPGNSMMRTTNGVKSTDTIHWIRETDMQGNWTYRMDAYDTSAYQFSWNPDGIYNDTLVIRAYGIDGVEYFFSKAK